MDGSRLDLIIIPIVVAISLAAWLIAVAYAATHPQWKNDVPAGASPAELAGTATGRPVLDFGPARASEDHARDEHADQVAATVRASGIPATTLTTIATASRDVPVGVVAGRGVVVAGV
jgi:hypothetical protein